MQHPYPILEFDPVQEAIIEPKRLISPLPEMPTHGVMTFFQDAIEHYVEQGRAHQITAMNSEMGDHPVYICQSDGRQFALAHPGIGAPLAAAILEEMIALGCGKILRSARTAREPSLPIGE